MFLPFANGAQQIFSHIVGEINIRLSQIAKMEQDKRGSYSRKAPAGEADCHKYNDKFHIIAI
jgi:hypothetical protein